MQGKTGTLIKTSILVMMVILLMAVGCNPESGDETTEPIKIGAILSTSGPLGVLGTPQYNSAVMAVEKVNAAGGINGREVQLIFLDDQSDDNQAVNNMMRLVTQDKVSAVFGTTAAAAYAVMDLAEQYEVPLLIPQPETDICEPVREWVFRVMVSDQRYVDRLLTYFKEQGITKFALMHDSTDYGEEAAEEFELKAPKFNMTITAREKYEPDDNDMTVQLTKIRDTSPDAIVVWGTVPGPAIIARNAKVLGIDIPFFGGTGINNPKFTELAGEASDGWVYPGVGFSVAEQIDDQVYQEIALGYIDEYQQKHNSHPGSFGALGWDGLQILLHVIEKSGSEPAAIKSGLESMTNYQGVFGAYSYSDTDHNGLGIDSLFIIRIEDGNRILVE